MNTKNLVLMALLVGVGTVLYFSYSWLWKRYEARLYVNDDVYWNIFIPYI